MSVHALSDELSAIRSDLLRLRQRERQLEQLMDQRAEGLAALRPGWPIQRMPAAQTHAH